VTTPPSKDGRSIVHAVRRLGSPVVFLVVAAGVYTTAFYFRSILATVDSPEVLAGALVVDLVVLVPAAYYFLVVRRFGLPVISVAGVFVLSLISATQIIPSEHQTVLTPLEIIAGIAEITILSFIAWKAVNGVRRYRAAAVEQRDEDAFNAIRGAARQVVDSERVADVLAFEIAILHYGLGSWRRRLVEGVGLYTSYKRSNYGSTLFGIGVLLAVELVAVHVIVQLYWSATGAWILSLLSAYAGVLLLSEWQAHRLRPTAITADALVLRAGVRWEVTIPFGRIQSFRRISAIEEKPRGALNLVAFGDALFEVKTDAPVKAHGAYGMRKSTACIWFTIDAPDEFQETLSMRLSGGA
jgi:membrane protein YdbS with pleckstrin-like domain